MFKNYKLSYWYHVFVIPHSWMIVFHCKRITLKMI